MEKEKWVILGFGEDVLVEIGVVSDRIFGSGYCLN